MGIITLSKTLNSRISRKPDALAYPWRTCVGCRIRAAKADLVRVVAVEGIVVPDVDGRISGRGAYLHRDLRCLDLAERRRAVAHALRVPGPLDLSALRQYVTEQVGTEGKEKVKTVWRQ